MRTELNEAGRVIVINSTPADKPQAYIICVKDPSDWEEIHNYIVNENEIDGIPNRKIECISELEFSPKRSVYDMSYEEAEVLKKHPKIEWVEISSMHNPVAIEQRKWDEKFDKHIFTNRFKENVVNRRIIGNPGTALTFTQWGLYRHQSKTNNFVGVGTTTTSADIQYSLTGKNVDVVIMDTGVRWDHPEFLKPGYTSVPVGVATESVSRVRDILIHGQSEYGIDWPFNGLTEPGTGSLSSYTKENALNSASFNGSWHGSHVAGTAAGNQFGAAFESNIWSIACVDRSDLGWAEPSDGFDYIRIWHKNKPINPETGRRNPTIVNCSWGHRQFVSYTDPYNVTFRGTSYSSTYSEANGNNLPAVYWMDTNSTYYEFTTRRVSGQTQVDELLDDLDCKDLILVCSAGNSGNGNGKQDVPSGVDYNNQFTSGTYFYTSGYDNYFNRNGTPAIGHIGQSDAPIKVGSLDSVIVTSGISSERKSYFSNNGPAIDVWSAGSHVLSPYSNEDFTPYGGGPAVQDPRNSSYYLQYLSGTSMAGPNVCGVLACYLESNLDATRVDVREWLYRHGSVVLQSGPGNPVLDQYGATNPVGAGTSVNYWSDQYGLRGASARILYNPYANNIIPSLRIV